MYYIYKDNIKYLTFDVHIDIIYRRAKKNVYINVNKEENKNKINTGTLVGWTRK